MQLLAGLKRTFTPKPHRVPIQLCGGVRWEAARTKHSLISSSLFIKQVATTEEIALKATQIKLKNTSLSLADSYLLAAADILHARIATTDTTLKGVRADTILLKF